MPSPALPRRAHRRGEPITTVAELPFGWNLPPGHGQLLLGSDLALWTHPAEYTPPGQTETLTRWEVDAINCDGEGLGQLAALPAPPDGATLALLADLARRAFPLHATLTQSDTAVE